MTAPRLYCPRCLERGNERPLVGLRTRHWLGLEIPTLPHMRESLAQQIQPRQQATHPQREETTMKVTIHPFSPRLYFAECSECLAGTITTHTRAQKWADKHEDKDCK